MLKRIFALRNRDILLVCVVVTLGLALLLVFQVNRAARMTYSSKEESSLSKPPVKPLAQNEEVSFPMPEHFPYGIAKIAFSRENAVYLYDAQTKASKRIGDGYNPDISPRGDAIAFTAERDDSGTNHTIKLFSLPTNTISEFQSLAKLNVREPHWSHDGTKLAFEVILEKRSHVGILDVSTGEWDDVTKGLVFNDQLGVNLNSWLANDESIVCHDLYNIYEISLNGNLVNRISIDGLVPSGEVSTSIRFQFSRDRKLLLFDGARNPENTTIYLYNIADHKLKQLTPKTMDGSEPVWLPSESEIMFSRARVNSSDVTFDLCVMSLDSGKVTTILNNASSGSYSTR